MTGVLQTGPSQPGPRLGLWGLFDLHEFGPALLPRITRHELERRLPGARVQTFAPYGYLRPTPFDGGDFAEPLGSWTPARLDELASQLDAVLVCGELPLDQDAHLAARYGVAATELAERGTGHFWLESLEPRLEERCPVLWSAVGLPKEISPELQSRLRRALSGRPYLSVRDERARQALERAGVERDVAVVPDPLLLAPRLFPTDVLAKRLAFLREGGWYPRDSRALVIQGDGTLLPSAAQLAEALADVTGRFGDVVPVLLELGPSGGDRAFGAALAARYPLPLFRLPAEAGLEDLAAALHDAVAFVGSSPAGHAVAFAYGRPQVLLNLFAQDALEDLGHLLGRPEQVIGRPEQLAPALARALGAEPPLEHRVRLQGRLDAHFDRVAELVERRLAESEGGRPETGAPIEPAYVAALERAHAARGRRLTAERLALLDHVRLLEWEQAGLHAEIQTQHDELERHRQVLAETRAYVAQLKEALEHQQATIQAQAAQLAAQPAALPPAQPRPVPPVARLRAALGAARRRAAARLRR